MFCPGSADQKDVEDAFGHHSPHEYGEWLPEDHQHPVHPDAVPARDAYHKRTYALWERVCAAQAQARDAAMESCIASRKVAPSLAAAGAPQAPPRAAAFASWVFRSGCALARIFLKQEGAHAAR